MALELISSKKSTSYNQKNDTRYVYVTEIFWDDVAEKKVQKRKVVGKIDPESGKEIETGSRGRPRKQNESSGNMNGNSIDYKQLYEALLADVSHPDHDRSNTQETANVVHCLQEVVTVLENAANQIKEILATLQMDSTPL